MNKNYISDSNEKLIRGFFRVFKPFEKETVIQSLIEKNVTLSNLYSSLLQERYIPLKIQNDIFYPTQRSKEWFASRERVESTITGSRPAGWYFDIRNIETYKLHLSYIHDGVKPKFTKDAIKRMQYGTKYEDYAQSCFLEYFTKRRQSNMYIYETGFQRNSEVPYLGASPDGLICEYFAGIIIGKRETDQFEGEEEYLIKYLNDFNEIDTFIIRGNERIELAKQYGKIMKEKEEQKYILLMEADVNVDNTWKDVENTVVYGGKFSVLEIKCPASKIYSSIPYYYYCQLHSEMAAYNIDETFFMCWHQKNGEERLRVWKLKFNKTFYKDFLQIVDLFRLKNSNGTRGAPWAIFAPYWFQFKIKYSNKNAWNKHVRPYFMPREYCTKRSYTDPFANKNSHSLAV